MSGAHLEVAPTLADLPADVAATPPDLIFLQNRLSGLSAEILSRHIRNQLSNAEGIAIVVLTESAGDAPDETALETAVSDEDLLAAARQVITGSAKRAEREAPSAGTPVPTAPEAETAFPATGVTAEPEDAATDGPISPEEFDVVSLGGRPADGTDGTGTRPPQTQPLNFREELESLTGPPRAETPPTPTPSPFPQSSPTPDGQRPKTLLWSVVAISVIAVGTIFFLSTRGTPPPPVPQQQSAPEKPAADVSDKSAATDSGAKQQNASTPDMPALPEPSPAASAATKGLRKTTLPGFIPPQSIVPGYGKNNPGWEQYVTPEFEFRVFRKGREVDALQVIDRTGKGMSRSFFTRTILEMAGVRDYRLQSKDIKGDYLIKRGTLTANAGVILYKKRDDTQLKAFVIHYQ